MSRILGILAILLLAYASTSNAAATLYQLPASSALFPGGVSTSSYPFNLANGTVQTNFTPTQMSNLSGKIEAFGLEFTGVCNKTWPSVKIYMGEGNLTPATWSTTFAANSNVVADQLVFDGALTVNITTAGLWSVPMTTPFNYSGQNTLVVTIRIAGSASGTGSFSHQVAYSGAINNLRMYSTSSATATTGSKQLSLGYGAEFSFSAGASWTGENSSDWNDTGNWEGGEVPTFELGATIPDAATTPNDPIIPAGAEAEGMVLEPGAILVGDTGDLNVYGNWENDSGTFVPGTSLVRYVGDDDQTILSGGGTVGNISVENTMKPVLVEDDWAAANTGNVALIAGAEMTFLGTALDFSGNSFDNQGLINLGLTDNGVTPTLQAITTNAGVDLGNVSINVIDAMDSVEFTGDATFNELGLDGMGTVSFFGNLQIGGELIVTMPGTLSITGNISGNGLLQFSTISDVNIGGTVDVGALTHDGEGLLTLGNNVTLSGDAKFLHTGTATVTTIGGALVVGGDLMVDSGSLVAGDVLTIAAQLSVTGMATFEKGSVTIAQDLTTGGLVMHGAGNITAVAGAHSIGDLNFDSQGSVTLNGTVDAMSVVTQGSGDISVGGDFTLDGDMSTASLGNFEIAGNLSFSGPQMQNVNIMASAIVCNRMRITGAVGTTLSGPVEATSTSGFLTAVFVDAASGLILDSGAEITMGAIGGVGIANIRGALNTASGAVTNRPLIKAASTSDADFGRVRFRSTSRVNLDGIAFERIGASGQAYGIEIDDGADVLAFNSVYMEECASNVAAIRLDTDSVPSVFQNFAVFGSAPANIDASNVTGIKIEVREAATGGGNLYGVPNEIDPNGILFWENPPQITILSNLVLPSVLAETTFSEQISAIGGNEPLHFTLLNAPAFLQINENTGELSGTPARTDIGAHTFALLVTDSSTPTNADSAIFTIIVDSLTEVPVNIVTGSELLTASEGEAYGYSLAASGGSGSGFTWALADASSLPNGLILTPEGVITGEVAEGTSGVYNFTAIATDSQGNSSARVFSIIVETEFTNPAVINAALSDGPTGSGGCALSSSQSAMLAAFLLALFGIAMIRRRSEA